MIVKTVYKTSDDKEFSSKIEAEEHEIFLRFETWCKTHIPPSDSHVQCVQMLWNNFAKISIIDSFDESED